MLTPNLAHFADAGNRPLQTRRGDGPSAAAEMQRDGGKLEPVQSDLHLTEAGERDGCGMEGVTGLSTGPF